MSKLVLSFDMDDTLCSTANFINEKIKEFFKQNDMKEELEYVLANEENVSTMLYPAWIKKHVDKEIIGPGLYMLEAGKTALCSPFSIGTLEALLEHHGDDIIVSVCSHRGFHPYGEIYTRQWLDENKLLHLFEDIHMLDSSVQPDKVTFLKETYPDHEILLIDDNPMSKHLGEVIPHHEEIVIYDEEHKLDAYVNQTRYQSPKQLSRLIMDRLERLL